MERKGESKNQSKMEEKKSVKEIRIAEIAYGSRQLTDCMGAVIRLHRKK